LVAVQDGDAVDGVEQADEVEVRSIRSSPLAQYERSVPIRGYAS
jgi:hypothetical protein